MGQYTVIIVLSAILLGGVILFNARSSTSAASTELSAYQADRIAREASQVALREVVRDLNARPDEWTNNLADAQTLFGIDTTTYNLDDDIETTYAVTLTEMLVDLAPPADTTDRVRLRVTSTFDIWNEGTQTVRPTDYIVEAVYERGWVDVNVPGGFRDAIMSDERVHIWGDAQVSGDIHSNDEIDSNGNAFDVFGSGTYTGSESVNYSRFRGDPPVAHRDSIVIPPVTIPPASYHAPAPAHWNGSIETDDDPRNTDPPGNTLTDGWLLDSANNFIVGKGTAADPYILYSNDHLTINGDIRLVGHIRIYVDGDFTMRGGSRLYSVLADPPELDQDVTVAQTWANTYLPGGVTIGIYVTGDVTFRGNTFIAATVYAYGEVSYCGGGNKMLIGGIVAHQPLEICGNAKVFYREGANSVYDPGIPRQVPEGVRLVAYREWADRP